MALLKSNTQIYGTANVQSVLVVGNITPNNATSNVTGSLQVIGGAGITGNLYSGNMVITGSGNGITFVDGTKQLTAGAPTSGYLPNTIIVANTSGNLSNTINLQFFASNNTLVVSNAISVGTSGITAANSIYVSGRVGFANANNISVVYTTYNSTFNSFDLIFG